jgi:two-component sensor histidine kinase
MHEASDVARNSKCDVTLRVICDSDGESPGFAEIARDHTTQKLLADSQLRLISQLEDRDAKRTQQLETTAQELERKNGEIAGYLSVISAQRQEKEVILREVYHRVKNNLQVVESLLKMKSRSLADATARGAIDTSIQRIRVMGMVHEHLYQMPDLGGVSLAAYLRGLIDGAVAAHPRKTGQTQFELDVEEIPLALDVAIPFGLLVNELLSNCFEHGLPNCSAGKIHVSVRRTSNGVRMVIKDDGIGLPKGFDPVRNETTGLKLAIGLAHQLGGTLKFTSSPGCQVEADFARMAGRLKSESHGIGQRMVAGAHPLLPIQYQA